MFLRGIAALVVASAGLAGLAGRGAVTSARVDSVMGPPVYTTDAAGYSVEVGPDFQAFQFTFVVPGVTGSLSGGFTGASLNSGGALAACGWDDIGTASGEIGCYDEAAPLGHSGWTDMLPSVDTGDLVSVSFTYSSTGKVTYKATDITQGSIPRTVSFKSTAGQVWQEPSIEASITSAPIPASDLPLVTFSAVTLTPAGGKATPLGAGSWTLQPVIATADGTSATQGVWHPDIASQPADIPGDPTQLSARGC